MLQTPINVYPNNGEVEHVNDKHVKIEFTFQGDFLSAVQGETMDEDNPTVDLHYVFMGQGRFEEYYNGQKVEYVDANVEGTDIGWMAYNMLPGANYKHRFRLFQHYPPSAPNARKPLADIYYARGKIMPTPEGVNLSSSQAVIAPGLTNIRTPFYNGWTDDDNVEHMELLGALFMEIRHEVHMIKSYDSSTGVVTFGEPVYNEYVDDDGYTILEIVPAQAEVPDAPLPSGTNFRTVGMPYRIFTNYIETGWYDFKWRTAPTITTTAVTNVDSTKIYHDYITDKTLTTGYKVFNGVDFEGTYVQNESVGLKWYDYQIYDVKAEKFKMYTNYKKSDLAIYSHKLYKAKEDFTSTSIFHSDDWDEIKDVTPYGKLIEDTGRRFVFDMRQTFPLNVFSDSYVCHFITTTQDNDTAHTDCALPRLTQNTTDANGHSPSFAQITINDVTVTTNDPTYTQTVDNSIIKIAWQYDGFNYNIFRREIYDDGTLADTCTYVGVHDGYNFNTVIYDYSAGNNHSYRYEIVAKSNISSEYGKPIAVCYIYNIHTKWNGWRISKIQPTETESNNNRQAMLVGAEWSFISDIDSGDITRNINSALCVGTGSYAQTTRNNNNYESGTFTANLLTVRCPDNKIIDDIQRVQEWMNFISGDNSFLLKSDKGDVWIVNIVNSPSRKYDETYDPIFTHVSYEWAESENVNKCTFYKE